MDITFYINIYEIRNNVNVAAFDHWSNNTKQDAWFNASSLHTVFDTMSNK